MTFKEEITASVNVEIEVVIGKRDGALRDSEGVGKEEGWYVEE